MFFITLLMKLNSTKTESPPEITETEMTHSSIRIVDEWREWKKI